MKSFVFDFICFIHFMKQAYRFSIYMSISFCYFSIIPYYFRLYLSILYSCFIFISEIPMSFHSFPLDLFHLTR